MQGPHIQIIVGRDPVPASLRTALNRLGARVSIRSIDKAANAGVSSTADVCVILSGYDQPTDQLERIVSNATNHACATMILPSSSVANDNQGNAIIQPIDGMDSPLPTYRLASPNSQSADALCADEILGRIKALCEIRRPLRRMRDELDRLKRQRPHPTSDLHDLNEQLRLAGQVQNDLLPKPLADSSPLEVATLYLPAHYVSGDIYDIARLDEHRIGISIADVTGHGLPAALLTFLIKKSLHGKEILDKAYRIVEPDELLNRLNDELFNARLSDCQFVTAMHAVFDRLSGNIRWARGGCPYPILIRPSKPPRQLLSEGGLIGAFPQHFELAQHDLQPGDVLVFYTDGVEALLLDRKNSTNKPSNGILETCWVRLLETDGPQAALEYIRDTAVRSVGADWPRDDITIIALRMN